MAKVFEIRDGSGIRWGVFITEEEAYAAMAELKEAPKSVQVVEGVMLDSEFSDIFNRGKPQTQDTLPENLQLFPRRPGRPPSKRPNS